MNHDMGHDAHDHPHHHGHKHHGWWWNKFWERIVFWFKNNKVENKAHFVVAPKKDGGEKYEGGSWFNWNWSTGKDRHYGSGW